MTNNSQSKNNYLLALTVSYVAFLLILPISSISHETFSKMFSEEGPFEILSILAWLVLAAQFAFSDFRPRVKWPMTLLFALFAAREADLHKAFTAQGMMKINYYTKSSAPLGEKVIAGMVALVFIAVLLYGAFLFLRFLYARSAWRTPVGRWLVLAAILMGVAKVLDRLPNILLEGYGIKFPLLLDMYFTSLEEGLELWVPVIMVWLSWERKQELVAFD